MDLPNIKLKKRPKVHWGFLRQFRSLEKHINADIQKYISLCGEHIPNITITGHSLGAAQCSLAGLQFSLQYPKIPISCYTFGSPRVGHTTFVKLFVEHVATHKRFVNEDDPVTMIPFAIRFVHLPGLQYFKEDNSLITDMKDSRWASMFGDLCLSMCGKQNPVDDHSCDRYYEKIYHANRESQYTPCYFYEDKRPETD